MEADSTGPQFLNGQCCFHPSIKGTLQIRVKEDGKAQNTPGDTHFHAHTHVHDENHLDSPWRDTTSASDSLATEIHCSCDCLCFSFDKDASEVWKQDHSTSLVRVTACSLPGMATFISSGKSHFRVTSVQDPTPLISYHADTWTPTSKNLSSHTHEVRASVIMKTSDVTSS